MSKKQIFSRRELGYGDLILGIAVFGTGIIWSIGVIYNYEPAYSIISRIQLSPPLLYGLGLIIGGVVLIIMGFKKLNSR